jgi:hypothetical protein
MIQNSRSIAIIGMTAIILTFIASAHAQDSAEGENWMPTDMGLQSTSMQSPDSASGSSPDSSVASSLDSSSASSQDSYLTSSLDSPSASALESSSESSLAPPSESAQESSSASSPDSPSASALESSSESSMDFLQPSNEDSRSSSVETVYISAKDYHPEATQLKYQIPQSSASSPLTTTSASKETETANSDQSPITPPVENQLVKPKNPNPADGAKEQSLNPMLSWSEVDGSSEVTYTVFMGTGPDSMSREYTVIKNSLILPVGLDKDTTYYWKVEATDGSETVIGDIWSFTTQDGPNQPPGRPQNPKPRDGARDVPINPTLTWSSEDPDGDALEYTVYLSNNSSVEPMEYNVWERFLLIPFNLSSGETYYWNIEASDGSLRNTSDTWSFTTQGEPNNPPNKPRDPAPVNHAKDQPTNPVLSWECEDPDGDPVTFTVYMGSTLSQMSEIFSGPEKNCSAPTSDYGVTNFWKVEASDGKLTNSSDVWSFTTREQPIWEHQTTVNALAAAIIAILGGFAVNYIKGRSK